jgi:hypothetical protein
MPEKLIDIEEKIVALMELSKSTAKGTEHEAKLALETAIRLAAKYDISINKLADKRKAYAGDWFQGVSDITTEVEYIDERYAEVHIRKWCKLAESCGWERYRKDYDDIEGHIWRYRILNRIPKIELRIFERPWGDIEYEVVKNPDPMLGHIEKWAMMGFDCIELGVVYYDFQAWLDKDMRSRT